jgi:hypothetical protein
MNTEDLGKHAIAIHVGNPTMDAAKMMFPADNWIASRLLWRLLQLALLRDGIENLLPPGYRGPLSDCVLTFAVDDREAAIESIKTELEGVALLPFCQIGISDGDGCKCIHPSPGIKMTWLLDVERQEHLAKELDKATQYFFRAQVPAGDKE